MTVRLVTTIQNFLGLSTDSKPTGVPPGSTFWEYDTGKRWATVDGTTWALQPTSLRYRIGNNNHWLGQPASAQNAIPASAGLTVTPGPSQIMRVYLSNNSAGTVSLCLAGFFPDSTWEAGQWVDATTTYTADTADAQDVDTNDFPINTTTINDGHIVGCDYKFGLVSYDMTTATVGAALAGVWEYWNGAWTAIAAVGMLVDIPRSAGVQWAVGELIVMFDPPPDWIVGGTGTGVNAARYNARYRSSAAGTTAGLARRLYLGIPITSWKGILTAVDAPVRDYSPKGLYIPDGVVRLGCAANLAAGTVSTVVATGMELVY